MRPVVNTTKHIVQFSLSSLAAGAIVPNVLATTAIVPAGINTQVREGAKISAIYIEMWVQSDDAAAGTVIVTLEKLPGSAIVMSTAHAANLNDYDNKKNILFTQMGLIPNNVTYPMNVIKGWIKIPKGKQRFGIEDGLVLNIFAQSNGLTFCGFALYKEQY